MVAKSYQQCELIGEPFTENGRQYIYIKRNGKERKVRWYTEAEFEKAFKVKLNTSEEKPVFDAKKALGFEKGYITIMKGDTYPLLDWFRESSARYHNIWGWYFVSTDEVPELPEGIEGVKLFWGDVADETTNVLKEKTDIEAKVGTLQYEASVSEFQGEIGERIERLLTVKRVVFSETNYGTSSFHIFYDENGNEYTWSTTSKTLEEGDTYTIRGTIKDLTIYHNSKQTVLTRCRVM